MGSIILLALGASVFPTLLACVAVIIARPEPRLLLLAFYAGALMTSITAGILVLAAATMVRARQRSLEQPATAPYSDAPTPRIDSRSRDAA